MSHLPYGPRAVSPDLSTDPICKCTHCGATGASPDKYLPVSIPVGWSKRGTAVWCADCTRAGRAFA